MLRGRYTPFNLAAFNARLNHGLLLGLDDDDHTQYLLANGTRALTDNWAVGGKDITGVGLGSFGNLDVDTLNLNGNVISDSTGTISFSNDNITTTGNITANGPTSTGAFQFLTVENVGGGVASDLVPDAGFGHNLGTSSIAWGVTYTGTLETNTIKNLAAAGAVTIKPSDDLSDYFHFSTTANVPQMRFFGANGKIIADGGTISLVTTDLITTTGSIGVGGVNADANLNVEQSNDKIGLRIKVEDATADFAIVVERHNNTTRRFSVDWEGMTMMNFLGVGGVSPSAAQSLNVNVATPARIGVKIAGHSSQSANIVEILKSTTLKAFFDASGNLGFVDGIKATFGTETTDLQIYSDGDNGVFDATGQILLNGTAVGINNSSPSARLDVGGTVRMTRLLAGGVTE